MPDYQHITAHSTADTGMAVRPKARIVPQAFALSRYGLQAGPLMRDDRC